MLFVLFLFLFLIFFLFQFFDRFFHCPCYLSDIGFFQPVILLFAFLWSPSLRYNAQATLHMYSALWSLMLPVTVHGRVSDIWRGYVAQKIMGLLGLRLVFSPSMVKQVPSLLS